MGKQHEDVAASPLNHTQHAFYVCSFLATLNIFYDSTHLFYERYHLNKKWFYLYGAMFAFGYFYTRPLIRRRLGSASERNINWSSIYAVWLCAAVFYHSPSFASLGLDIKADVSMLIAVFLGSLLILSIINALYGLAVLFRILSPRLLDQNSGPRDVFTTVILNSVNLAIACSLYYSLCGNAPGDGEFAVAGGTSPHNNSTTGDVVRSSVCGKWLHPLSAVQHPLFSAWVIYGEAVGSDSTNTTASGAGGSLSYWASGSAAATAALVDDDSGTEHAISPVFTTWLTIFAMLVVNSVADYLGGATISTAYSSETRKYMASASRRAAYRRLHRRRRSADYTAADRHRFGNTSLDSMSSLGFLTRPNSKSAGLDAILKTVSSVGSLWSPTNLETMGLKAASALLFRDDFGVGLNPSPAIDGVYDITPAPSSLLADPQTAAGVGLPVAPDAPTPSFLPMFPWYSGTSADLVKTLFNLILSVKVFLGRFDQRTMQAVTATSSGGCGSADAAASGLPSAPHDGDGFTYEHLAEHEEAWIDFVADTGDGGDSTYSVARCLAAPQITVDLPKEMLEASGAPLPPLIPPISALAATDLQNGSFNTPPTHTATGTTNASPTTRVLPRGTCLVHGGDLAYPNPTDETYEKRLFKMYEDALPPPAHVHPGNLVINKPDLPPEYWEAADRACTCPHSKMNSNGDVDSADGRNNSDGVPCHTCRKAKVLNVYDGPSAFLIPGNHDHFDGLETFTRHIVHKGWLGGWLLPQEKSYFALRLPRGWWLFAMDLALVEDLDMAQYRYFARIAEERMAPNDSSIIVSHAPQWLINWFWGRTEGKNMRQLLRGPLRGRARMHLCGDLHFYMRHSFKPYTGTAAGAGGISPSPSEMSTPAGGSPLGGGSPTSTRCPTPIFTSSGSVIGQQQGLSGSSPPASRQLHQSLLNKLKAVRTGGGASPVAGSSPVVGRSINKDTILGTPPRLSRGSVDTNGGVPIKKGKDAAAPLSGGSTDDEGTAAAIPSAMTSLGASPPDQNGSLHFHPAPPGSSPTTTRSTIENSNGGTAALTSRLRPLTPPGGAAGGSPCSKRDLEHEGGDSDHIGPQAWWPSLKCNTPKAAAAAAVTNGGSPLAAAIAAVPTITGFKSSTAASTNFRKNAYSASGHSPIDGGGGEWEAPPAGWLLNDPEHLVVCGSGGAFLHPTHVFSYSRFRPPHDPAAGPLYLRPPRESMFAPSQQQLQGQDSVGAGNGNQVNSFGGGKGLRRSLPSDSSLYSLPRSTKDETRSGNEGLNSSGFQRPAGGEYRCQAAFPSPEQSLRLGRSNLHTFRHVNSRFDIIGGVFYYLLVISVLPRCTGVGAILEAQSVVEGMRLFFGAGLSTIAEIFESSYISLAAFAFLFMVVFGFAGSGGVGAISGIPPAARRRPEYKGFGLAVRARLGGLPTRLAYAAAHATAHLSAAITLLILLELGIEMVMKYEGVGEDGYHSLYKWYRSFEALHFPDPAGLRSTLSTLTLGIYPNVIKWAFAIFDIPEAIAVSRTAMCTAGGTIAALTRIQTLGYYGGVLLYFWVLATPTVGLIFGLYLYVSGNWLHVHYDESFSALQVAHHKGFVRLHITKTGDLEVFALGLEESPCNWREDPRWKSPGGGGVTGVAGHRARWPSRWVPVLESAAFLLGGRLRKGSLKTATPPEAQLKVVDYFYVPKKPVST